VVVADKKVEYEVVDTGCSTAELCKLVKVRATRVIESYHFSIHNRSLWKFAKGFNKVWILIVEGFVPTRE
jgi:hypothetical protein